MARGATRGAVAKTARAKRAATRSKEQKDSEEWTVEFEFKIPGGSMDGIDGNQSVASTSIAKQDYTLYPPWGESSHSLVVSNPSDTANVSVAYDANQAVVTSSGATYVFAA